jgi:hypothetical protein
VRGTEASFHKPITDARLAGVERPIERAVSSAPDELSNSGSLALLRKDFVDHMVKPGSLNELPQALHNLRLKHHSDKDFAEVDS